MNVSQTYRRSKAPVNVFSQRGVVGGGGGEIRQRIDNT